MILFWFLIGIALILGISRYNENEKLFWALFVSFIGAFAATVAVQEYNDRKERDKIESTYLFPTQVLNSTSHDVCVLADMSITVINEEKSSDPVSKEYINMYNSLIPSKIVRRTRDQPVEYFDTS